MIRSSRCATVIAAVVSLALPIAPKQSQNQPSDAASVPTIKTSVRQVLVPIVVTGKKGHPVSGLKESDFAIFEDDTPQRIVAFSKTYATSLEMPSHPMGSLV